MYKKYIVRLSDEERQVCEMEAVLETYEKAYDPGRPVLCMDEQPVQLLDETRTSIPATRPANESRWFATI